jgi:CheY-like chemotaxis protein
LELQVKCEDDLKGLDFCIELLNAVEICYSSEDSKEVSFQINFNTRKFFVFTNEVKLKVYLFTLLSFIKLKAREDSMVTLTVKETESNQNASRQSLIINFVSASLSLLEIEAFLQPRSLRIDEPIDLPQISAWLLAQIGKGLNIEVQRPCLSNNLFSLELLLNFQNFDQSQNHPTAPRVLLWQNPIKTRQKTQENLKLTHPISIFLLPKPILKLKKLEIKSNSSKNSSLNESPQSLPNFLHPRSFATIAGISGGFLKRSATVFKLRKSRKNNNRSPNYSPTNNRPIKRFFFRESLKKLNFEFGVFKVLIVDDFEEGRRVLQGLLKVIMNVSCEFAKDGLGAIEMFESYAGQGFMYQVIFMDLVMPRMGGYDAALQIRGREKKNSFPRTFICAVSGDSDCYEKVAKFDIDEVGKG